ncbi:MAG: hypothetical protein ABIT10_11540 [Alteraurantiacibacter sp.]
MTLRRLADMAHSRGYDAFVTQEEECEAYLLNGSEYSRSCRYEATMSNVADPTEEMADEETAYLVAEIFALTDSERSSYPRPTGIFLRGNDCLFD